MERGVQPLPDSPVIMIAEDDEAVQAIVEEALTDGGFEVEIVASGEEALTLLQGDEGKYRALVIDINLRGRMDGWTIAKRARELRPEFPIVYTTAANGHEWPFAWRSEQHSVDEALRRCAARHGCFQLAQYGVTADGPNVIRHGRGLVSSIAG